jgi:hypothetical protein
MRLECLEHRALTSLLPLEDVYQNKSYVLSHFVIFIHKERDPLFGNLSVNLLFNLPFTFRFYPSPSKRSGAWFRSGPEALGGLALPTYGSHDLKGFLHTLRFQVPIMCLAFTFLMNVLKLLVRDA